MNVMRARYFAILTLCGAAAWAQPKSEPRISSVYPLTGQCGRTYSAVVRGTNLESAKGVYFKDAGLSARVIRTEPQAVHLEITAAGNVGGGVHSLRLMTASGLSNSVPLRIAEGPVITEQPKDEEHLVPSIPAIVTGRLNESGETDDYWFEAKAGQTITVEAFSGSDTLDPSVGLYERSGSWFDAKRLNRVAFNEEALPFPGIPKDARVSYRILQTGRYCARVQGFVGQGGPDSVYEVRISTAIIPERELRPVVRSDWEEREFTRALDADWMQRLAQRGAPRSISPKPPERYHAVPAGSADVPLMKLPGLVEGVIAKAGESHVVKIEVEKAQDVVIEVDTPQATAPRFNPVVRLLEPGGTEIVSNVYTRLNNNNLKMMKAMKAKATFSLAAPGTYTLEIHELATDCAGDDYRYRILVRPQIPHMGKFIVQQERINLERGATQPVSVRIEREEGFSGIVAVEVDNLPVGVTAFTAIENPAERPVLPNAGKTERYQPRVQATSVILSAGGDAAISGSPSMVRVVARAVMEGKLGDPIASVELPLTVIEKK